MLESGVRPRFSVNNLTMSGGERFALLIDDRSGLPDPWATRYCVLFLRTKRGSVNTMIKSLRALALLYGWADSRKVDLTARIETLDLLNQEETVDLVNWLRESRAVTSQKSGDRTASVAADVVHPDTNYSRVMAVRSYLKWRAEITIHRISIVSGRYRDASQKLSDWGEMIGALVRGAPQSKKYGITPELRSRLLEIIDPTSPENPFAAAHRFRNYALLLTYYELGLRRAEALVIKSGDLKFVGNELSVHIVARPDDPADPRPDEPLVKTASRILPAGPKLRQAIEAWLIRHRSDRSRYPGAKKTPFVFVSENGRPMASRTVYDLFVRIRDAFPEFPRDFSPHTLRHDWNDRFSDLCDAVRETEVGAGVPLDERTTEAKEKALRNYLMGWKKHSERSATYTNRYTERKAEQLMLKLQDKSING